MADPLSCIRGRMLQDRSSGTAKSLAEYARLFPGEDALVARSYSDVFGAAANSPASSDQDSIGHYRILKELGRGGQGVVYLAEDTRLRRKVALKVLTGLGPGSEDSVHRLRREAEVASRLEHPGICGVHDAGVANGTPYIAMHYVEGKTLADRISETRSLATAGESSSVVMLSELPSAESPNEEAGPSPATTAMTTKQEIPEILRVFERAAQALHAAHEAGIVHRDIKPGNIMVNASGQPVILDFGLARAEDMDLQTLTRTGDVFGTPAYMSPEQISGQRIRLDRRSDVYSLGVTLYECLTLRRPFEAPTREGVYQAVMTKSPTDPRKLNPAISKDLKVVVETALEKDRDRRYATADALARDLLAVLEGRPIQARPVGPVGRFVRWSKREPAKAALLGVILVAFPVIATLVTSHVKDRPQVEAARLANIELKKDEILSEASYEVTEGDAEKALALYTQVLEMEGGSAEAVGGLVLGHLKLKNASVALQLLDSHRALLGDGAAAHLLRADALLALGRKDEAESVLRVAPPPESAFEHHLIAVKNLQAGEGGDRPAFVSALRHVTTAILLSPAPRLSLYTLRAHAAGHVKDRVAALETAAGLRHRWPDKGLAFFWCGYAMEEVDDPRLLDEAIAAYREGIRVEPERASLHRNLGFTLQKKGLLDEAILALTEAIRLRPKDVQARSNLGWDLLKKGRVDDALTIFREGRRLNPDEGACHADVGAALIDKGLIDDALEPLREAIRLKPDVQDAHRNVSIVLAKKGFLDLAIEAGRKAIEVHPDDPFAHSHLGGLLGRKDLIDEAIAVCQEAIRLKPDLADAHMKLGNAFIRKGLLDDAILAYTEAIRLRPETDTVHHNLGLALGLKGRFTEAIAVFRDAARLKPNDAETFYNMGNALVTNGLQDDAIAAFREAVRLNPDYAEAHCNLGRCLSARDRSGEALAVLRRGHEIGSRRPDWPYPSQQWIADAQQRVDDQGDREARLADHVATGTQPESASDLVDLARVALEQRRPVLAARWFQAAFRESPDFADAIVAGHRRQAVRATVLASIGRTESAPVLDEAARRTWRLQALSWLEDELAAITKALEARRLPPRDVRISLVPLTRTPDLASVRGSDAIAKLPPSEQPRWTKLWSDIDALLASLDRRPESR